MRADLLATFVALVKAGVDLDMVQGLLGMDADDFRTLREVDTRLETDYSGLLYQTAVDWLNDVITDEQFWTPE